MKHPHWSEINFYFNEFNQQKNSLENKKLTPEVLMTIRNSLMTSTKHLRNNLKQTLNEDSVRLIIFAITSLVDEEVQGLLLKTIESPQWTPLQKDLHNLTNAGEVFFENLDEILEETHFPAIVYEIYYLVLKKGFRGKYEHSQNRISKYIEFLAAKIEEPALVEKESARNKTSAPLPKIRFKVWQYYATAASLIFCTYVSFAINTNL